MLRVKLLEMVKQGKTTLKAAVVQLNISYRQGIRLYRKYHERGDAGLPRGSMGKPSNRKTAKDIRGRAIEQYRLRYNDFGPAFAAEKLAKEAGVKISVSPLRRILIEENHRTRAPRFQRLAHRAKRVELRSLRESANSTPLVGTPADVGTLPRSGYETHWWALAGAGGREYRSRRAPRPRFGEMARFDGSPRAWFENRGRAAA